MFDSERASVLSKAVLLLQYAVTFVSSFSQWKQFLVVFNFQFFLVRCVIVYSYLWYCIQPGDGCIWPKHVDNCSLQIKLCLNCGSSFFFTYNRYPVHMKVILKYRISWCIRSVKSLEEEIKEYFVLKAVHVHDSQCHF